MRDSRRIFPAYALLAFMLCGCVNTSFAEPIDPPETWRRTSLIADVNEAVVFTINEARWSPYTADLARRSGSDLLIRSCFKWCDAPNLDPRATQQARTGGALFGGGVTCSTFYEDENKITPQQVADMATRGIDGEMLVWPPGSKERRISHHGSLSSPAYLNWVLRWSREQIDAGVDALFMDESDAALLPTEGFDDYSIKDFARYLLTENLETKGWLPNDVRWTTRFNVNLQDVRLVPDGAITSFDYRPYLRNLGLRQSEDARNPLAPSWKRFQKWRDRRAWKNLTDRIRAYAQENGRRVLISGNGLWPFVDFQVTNNWKEDEQMERDGKIDLTKSGMPEWRHVVELGQSVAEKHVPVVFFHDWGMAFPWMAVPPGERNVWMRTRGAEIYAAGGFFAFPVFGPLGCDAGKDGTLETISREAAFYQTHRNLYLRGQFLGVSSVQADAPDLSLAVWIAEDPRVLLVHLINRQHVGATLQRRQQITVSLPVEKSPEQARAFSPDWNGERTAACSSAAGRLNILLEELDAHAIVELRFKEAVEPATLTRLGDPKEPVIAP